MVQKPYLSYHFLPVTGVFTMVKWDKSPSHHNKMVIYKAGCLYIIFRPKKIRESSQNFYGQKYGDLTYFHKMDPEIPIGLMKHITNWVAH